MDGAGRFPTGLLCRTVWRSSLGFHSQSFRFEGGGRQIIGRLFGDGKVLQGAFPLTTNHLWVFVVGLNRTGKSCRLRWVNYLHPGLKRGKMTPQEERLVLELHGKWGNRFFWIFGFDFFFSFVFVLVFSFYLMCLTIMEFVFTFFFLVGMCMVKSQMVKNC